MYRIGKTIVANEKELILLCNVFHEKGFREGVNRVQTDVTEALTDYYIKCSKQKKGQ